MKKTTNLWKLSQANWSIFI